MLEKIPRAIKAGGICALDPLTTTIPAKEMTKKSHCTSAFAHQKYSSDEGGEKWTEVLNGYRGTERHLLNGVKEDREGGGACDSSD